MKNNQKKTINKQSQLERLKLIWLIIMGLLMVNCIWFVILSQFPENKSLIKGIKNHEYIRD